MNENNFFINYVVFKSKTLHSFLAFKNKAWLLSRTLPTVFKVSHIVQLLFQIHSVEKNLVRCFKPTNSCLHDLQCTLLMNVCVTPPTPNIKINVWWQNMSCFHPTRTRLLVMCTSGYTESCV